MYILRGVPEAKQHFHRFVEIGRQKVVRLPGVEMNVGKILDFDCDYEGPTLEVR